MIYQDGSSPKRTNPAGRDDRRCGATKSHRGPVVIPGPDFSFATNNWSKINSPDPPDLGRNTIAQYPVGLKDIRDRYQLPSNAAWYCFGVFRSHSTSGDSTATRRV